jgi:small subunit ribosomal protein S9
VTENALYQATGKRKTSIAVVFLKDGNGEFTVNQLPFDNYFKERSAKMVVSLPLALTETQGKLNIVANVKGGGISGQLDAIRHGISKALTEYNPEFRKILKKEGLLTRDSRIKERKKYGQRGARARFQFSKR